jgi:hypothetical protein
MNGSSVVAFVGGACVCAALSGACAALTADPPVALLLTGLVLVSLALSRSRAACPALAGAFAGALLPSTAPPAPGGVVTQAVGAAMRGDIFDVLQRLDDDPAGVLGHRVSVSGEWGGKTSSDPASVSRRLMSCCAADSIAVGFDVELSRPEAVPMRSWVRVDGIVRERIRDGDRRYVLEQSTIRRLEDPYGSAH